MYGDRKKTRALELALGLTRGPDGLMPGNDGTRAELTARERAETVDRVVRGRTAQKPEDGLEYFVDEADGRTKLRPAGPEGAGRPDYERCWGAHGLRTRVYDGHHQDLAIRQCDETGRGGLLKAGQYDHWLSFHALVIAYVRALGQAGGPATAAWRAQLASAAGKDGHAHVGELREHLEELEELSQDYRSGRFRMFLRDREFRPALRDGRLTLVTCEGIKPWKEAHPEDRDYHGDVSFGPDDLPHLLEICRLRFARYPGLAATVLEALGGA